MPKLRDEIAKIILPLVDYDRDRAYRKADAIMGLEVIMKCPDNTTCFEKGCVSWSEPCKGYVTKTLAELEEK
jgi:hypothetical protein